MKHFKSTQLQIFSLESMFSTSESVYRILRPSFFFFFWNWQISTHCFCSSNLSVAINYNLFSNSFSNKFMSRFLLSVMTDWEILVNSLAEKNEKSCRIFMWRCEKPIKQWRMRKLILVEKRYTHHSTLL